MNDGYTKYDDRHAYNYEGTTDSRIAACGMAAEAGFDTANHGGFAILGLTNGKWEVYELFTGSADPHSDYYAKYPTRAAALADIITGATYPVKRLEVVGCECHAA